MATIARPPTIRPSSTVAAVRPSSSSIVKPLSSPTPSVSKPISTTSSTPSKQPTTTLSSPSVTPTNSNNTASPPSSGLGKTTTIVIAIVASVAGFILVLLIYRYLRRHINKRGVPLPPVQPIAHHREQHLAQFEEWKFGGSSVRNSTWTQQQQLPDQTMGSSTTSDASNSDHLPPLIVPHTTRASHSVPPSPNASQHEVALINTDKPLPHPHPAFHGSPTRNPRDSNSSFGSDPTPSPFLDAPASPSSLTHSPSLTSTRQHQLRPPRPSSMVSTGSRKSVAFGAPHGPHSNVQIVLPTPLAPGLSPYGREDVFGDGHAVPRASWASGGERQRADSRLSVVDRWAGVSVGRSTGDERERKGSFGGAYADHRRASIDTTGSRYSQSFLPPQQQQQPTAPFRPRPRHHSPSPTPSPRNSRYGLTPPPSSFREHSLTPPPSSPSSYHHQQQPPQQQQQQLHGATPPVPRIPSKFHPASPPPGVVNLDYDDYAEVDGTGGVSRRSSGSQYSR